MSAEIKKFTNEPVTLVGGGGGIFEVRRDGEVIWKKRSSGEYPTAEDVAELFG